MPTDNEIIEGAARAIGLDPIYQSVEGEGGYWTVSARPGSVTKRTTWNPLRDAGQSQRLQVELLIWTMVNTDGSVDTFARREHEASVPLLPVGRELTLRRAIAIAAYQCRPATDRPGEV